MLSSAYRTMASGLVLALALFSASWAQEQRLQNGTLAEQRSAAAVGQDAFDRGDYPTAIQAWTTLAQQGNDVAQYNLGIMYAQGQGVTQDYVEAVKWYRKAAEQGFAPAQVNLGIMYGQGKGVPQDDVEAVKWYRKAAEQGYALAQYNLGVMYAEEIGRAHV